MKVIVTRDELGVQIWDGDAKLVYKRPFHGGFKVWMKARLFNSGHRILDSVEVKEHFPHILDLPHLKNGTQLYGSIVLTTTTLKVY